MKRALATIRLCLLPLDLHWRLRWTRQLALALVATGLESVGAVGVFGLIGLVGDPNGLSHLPIAGPFLAFLAQALGERAVPYLALAIALFYVLKNLFLQIQTYSQEKCAQHTAVFVGKQLLAGYLAAPYPFHLAHNSAELMRTLDFSVDHAYRVVLLSVTRLVGELFIILGIVAVLLAADIVITLVAFTIVGLLAFAILKGTQGSYGRWGALGQDLHRRILQAMQQSLGSIKEVKVLGRESYFLDRFLEARQARANVQILSATFAQFPRLSLEAVMVAGMMAVMALAQTQGRSPQSIIPILGLFAYAGFRIMPSVNRVVTNLNNIRQGEAAVAAMAADFASNQPACMPTSDQAGISFARDLVLENVGFTYPGRETPVLKAINLRLPRAGSLGLAGSTGAGKSTLADLILGLLAPTEGRILVDGASIAGQERAWQKHLGYVPQVIYLLDDTVARNIALGIKDADINRERLIQVARMAHILDVIEALPQGWETPVGERGVRLSGGQRQRLGIARALYHDPALLVFDEATSALDSETEQAIGQAIDALSGTKTIILIAHRLSTLKHCDTIAFLKDGALTGLASYETLVTENEDFRRLANFDASFEKASA